MSKLDVDLALVRKYNVAGPRYTSYPPATRFSNDFKWPQLAEELLANNRTDRDLSLYFHIPFCESLCWYCGCTTVITTQHSQGAVYLEHVEREIDQMGTVLNPARKVSQMHLGGGTPTFLTPSELRALGRMIKSRFRVACDVEGGVEIDPRRLTHDHVVALREAGFNRASLGVQDFDPKVQLAVHRFQPLALTKQAIDWLRREGFQSINIDLIYGLPYQTVASFRKTLASVLDLKPDRLAVFNYAHVPWVKPAQKILEDALPGPEEKLNILKLTIETLTAGDEYVYIGMDHFAKASDELAIAQRTKTLHRNFQGYSTRGGADIYSFGMSAISQTENAYWQNQKELPLYYEAIQAGRSPMARGYFLTEEDHIRREIIMRLMCDLSLDFTKMSHKLGFTFSERFSREVESLSDFVHDGLIRWSPKGFEVTTAGRLFIRNIAMRFDAHLPSETAGKYSKTI